MFPPKFPSKVDVKVDILLSVSHISWVFTRKLVIMWGNFLNINVQLALNMCLMEQVVFHFELSR